MPPKTPPNCLDRNFLSRQSQANPFFTDPSPFPPNLNFFGFPLFFLSKPPPPQISPFSGSGVPPKNNYSQNQPSGGSFFSKKTPPWILRPSRVWIFQKSSPKKSQIIFPYLRVWTSRQAVDDFQFLGEILTPFLLKSRGVSFWEISTPRRAGLGRNFF